MSSNHFDDFRSMLLEMPNCHKDHLSGSLR